MIRSRVFSGLTVFALLFAVGGVWAQGPDPAAPGAGQAALGTGFTYQGRLESGGSAVSGVCGFQFGLWDAVSGGAQSGITQTVGAITVNEGFFTVLLNNGNEFGGSAFNGTARWLNITVRCPDSDAYTALTPRQALTAAPYAVYALNAGAAPWAGLTGVPAGFSDNTDNTGSDWSLTGNAGTTGANFIGTTDNMTLTFKANGVTAFRLVTTSGSPNVLGGDDSNVIGAGVTGATVGGGALNSAASYGTVSGGVVNHATALYATVGGGYNNTITGTYGTVAGGQGNLVRGAGSTIGGGGTDGIGISGNQIFAAASTIAGGWGNTIYPLAHYSTIGGGQGHVVSPSVTYATVAGGINNVAGGHGAAIGGGGTNGVTHSGNHALAAASTIGGGYGNVVTTTATYATVAGGEGNSAVGTHATVSGGQNNTAGGGGTVGGGTNNTATGGTVAGGSDNTASAGGAIGGGEDNTAGGVDTVAGGSNNQATGGGSSISGGTNNEASGAAATVGGGNDNHATATTATVGGGERNIASALRSTVSGGSDNTASNDYATVPGGDDNTASGQYSFAAGRNARAVHNGAFVWADSNTNIISSTVDNQFLVRASGGVSLTTTADGTMGASLPAGSGTWGSFSDRNAKANFAAVDGVAILNTLMGIPVETWNYKAQDAAIRHMGPMAQDFYAAFGLGEGETTISVVDADGVALAAIQGLYTIVKEKDAALTAQGERISALEVRLAALEAGETPHLGISTEALRWLLLGLVLGAVGWRAYSRRSSRTGLTSTGTAVTGTNATSKLPV